MEIIIDNHTTLDEIQKAFNDHFSCLKLEFFVFESGAETLYSKKNMVTDRNRKVAELSHFSVPVSIRIHAKQKVSTLEKQFKREAGLEVQVFRKSGSSWIETGATDDWTLSYQNKTGMDSKLSKGNSAPPEIEFYHEQS